MFTEKAYINFSKKIEIYKNQIIFPMDNMFKLSIHGAGFYCCPHLYFNINFNKYNIKKIKLIKKWNILVPVSFEYNLMAL